MVKTGTRKQIARLLMQAKELAVQNRDNELVYFINMAGLWLLSVQAQCMEEMDMTANMREEDLKLSTH